MSDLQDNGSTFDEYRRKKPSKADYRKEEKLEALEHQIHQVLATGVIGCRSTRNDMKFSRGKMCFLELPAPLSLPPHAGY